MTLTKVKVAVVAALMVAGVAMAQSVPSTLPTKAPAAQTRPTGRAWLGITITSMDDSETRQIATDFGYAGKTGMLVQQVMPDSPAAGILREGDFLIEVDGENITDVGVIQKHVAAAGVGGKVALTIFREKKMEKVDVTVGAAPPSAARARSAGK